MKVKSEYIKTLRIEKKWSQEHLAEASGLNLRTIQRIENTGNASLDSVRALAAVFEVDSKELIIGEENALHKPIDTIKYCIINFANFEGKASRYEFWWFFLFVLLVAAIGMVIHESMYQIIGIIVLVPFLAVGTRRLNDIEKSGWWQLLYVIPFGAFVVWFMMTIEAEDLSSKS